MNYKEQTYLTTGGTTARDYRDYKLERGTRTTTPALIRETRTTAPTLIFALCSVFLDSYTSSVAAPSLMLPFMLASRALLLYT
jgi:hypothetical protein